MTGNAYSFYVGFLSAKRTGESMAKKPAAKPKSPTMREQATAEQSKRSKPRRLKAKASQAKKPLSSAKNFSQKEIHLPFAHGKQDTFLHKKRSFIPAYFRESWQELKQVDWPNRRQTFKLSVAVIMFAVVFAFMIAIVDYGLDKLFRRIIL